MLHPVSFHCVYRSRTAHEVRVLATVEDPEHAEILGNVPESSSVLALFGDGEHRISLVELVFVHRTFAESVSFAASVSGFFGMNLRHASRNRYRAHRDSVTDGWISAARGIGSRAKEEVRT